MADRQILLADANGGWSVDTACEIISCFKDSRIVWEEACWTYDENAEETALLRSPWESKLMFPVKLISYGDLPTR